MTSALLPNGIAPNDSLDQWLEMLPLVDNKLVARWYDLHKAKIALNDELEMQRQALVMPADVQ